jgi:hypothetical protein
MNRSTDLLAEEANALARQVAELPWGEHEQGLDGLLAGAKDGTLLGLAERAGSLAKLLDAVACRISGEIAARSERNAVDPLAKRMGERTAAALVARSAGVGTGRAADWCSIGRPLAARSSLSGEPLPPAFPQLAEALDSGLLSADAARVLVDTLQKVSVTASHEQVELLEAFLVEQSRYVSVADLPVLCRRVRDQFDPDGIEPREEELRARAGFSIVHRRDGLLRWVIDAHPEAAGFLTAALDANLAPSRRVAFLDPDEAAVDDALADTRTLAQKRLDALVAIAKGSLRADAGDVSGTAVTMLVSIDAAALVSGIGAATIFGVDEPISAGAARRLACEAKILPVVLGGASQPLDLGRERRLFTEAQRVAMAIRDGGCVWPGCQEPPGRCQAAHLEPWFPAGRTDLVNGVLLCPFHHRRFDRDGWSMRFEDGVPYLIPPPWVDPAGTPRRAGRVSAPVPV